MLSKEHKPKKHYDYVGACKDHKSKEGLPKMEFYEKSKGTPEQGKCNGKMKW